MNANVKEDIKFCDQSLTEVDGERMLTMFGLSQS